MEVFAMSQNIKNSLTIVELPISQLKGFPGNPRSWPGKSEADLSESLKRFGQVDPVLIDQNNVVIGGNFRHHVMKKLGYETIKCVRLRLSDDQARELNLRLNKNQGEFDLDLLKAFDIDLLLDVGFDDTDLGDIWNASLEVEDDDFDEQKAIKKATTTDIKLGDMFALGKHRLICGDAGDPATIKRLVGDLKPNMLYTDPVYNISLDYDKGVGNKASYGGKTNDTRTDTEYAAFLSSALVNALAVMDKDAHVFMFCDQSFIWLLQTLMVQNGLVNRRVCLWIKNGFSPTPGVAFNKAFEPCVYATRGTPYLSDVHNLTEILNKEIAPGNRAIDDIIDIFDIWLAKREAGQDYQHPTQKPLTLHEKPLKRCTKIGDVVLDYYGGSGSTLLSCEQMKRVALLCEIEPVFCQVTIDRFEAMTGEKAVKL
jgi:DNA modification methylase